MGPIIDKLKEFFESQNVTQRDVAEQLGVKPQFINAIFSGRSKIGYKTADKLSEKFGISKRWLLTGEGEMLTRTPAEIVYDANPYFDDFTIQGGVSHGFGDEQAVTPAGHMRIPDIPVSPDIPYIRVRGNSMLNRKDPTRSIPDGAWIAIKRSQLSTIRWGEVYAFMTLDGPMVKKLMPAQKENCVQCVSFNEDDGYLPFELNVDEIINGQIYTIVGVAAVKLW